MPAPMPIDPYLRDSYARSVRRGLWAPEAGIVRFRRGPLAVALTWPYNRYCLDRFRLLGGCLTFASPRSADWLKVEGSLTLLGCTLTVMVGSYYASVDLT